MRLYALDMSSHLNVIMHDCTNRVNKWKLSYTESTQMSEKRWASRYKIIKIKYDLWPPDLKNQQTHRVTVSFETRLQQETRWKMQQSSKDASCGLIWSYDHFNIKLDWWARRRNSARRSEPLQKLRKLVNISLLVSIYDYLSNHSW